jgi:hypothetical protein
MLVPYDISNVETLDPAMVENFSFSAKITPFFQLSTAYDLWKKEDDEKK